MQKHKWFTQHGCKMRDLKDCGLSEKRRVCESIEFQSLDFLDTKDQTN